MCFLTANSLMDTIDRKVLYSMHFGEYTVNIQVHLIKLEFHGKVHLFQ